MLWCLYELVMVTRGSGGIGCWLACYPGPDVVILTVMLEPSVTGEEMTSFNLAQLNIAQLLAPLDSPGLVDFVANLNRINALADAAPGFVWRLQTEDGDSTAIKFFGEDFIVNLSVWENIQVLHNYVYRTAHIEVMRRRSEWFQKMKQAYMVLWWIPVGHIPSLQEAENRLQQLNEHGPSENAFTFKKPFPIPERASIQSS